MTWINVLWYPVDTDVFNPLDLCMTYGFKLSVLVLILMITSAVLVLDAKVLVLIGHLLVLVLITNVLKHLSKYEASMSTSHLMVLSVVV